MTTKQDKKPVPFIKAGELIKKELKDVYTTYKYGIEDKEYTGWNGGWHACLHIAHSLYDYKFGVDNSAKRYAKVTKLAKRLEREFLRKEEKEKQHQEKLYLILYSIKLLR